MLRAGTCHKAPCDRRGGGGGGGRTGVSNVGQVFADAREFGGRHTHYCRVLCVRDAQVLAVNVHEFELKVRDAIILCVQEERGSAGLLAGVRTFASS